MKAILEALRGLTGGGRPLSSNDGYKYTVGQLPPGYNPNDPMDVARIKPWLDAGMPYDMIPMADRSHIQLLGAKGSNGFWRMQ